MKASARKRNGAAWSPLGSGFTTTVNALAAIGTNLYAGGNFTIAGGIDAARVAKWDGAAWSPLGSGVYRAPSGGVVSALASAGNDLFVGGSGLFAGTNRSYFIARWNDGINFANPARILLANPRRLSSGAFRFTVTASGAADYVIERTSDLANWLPIYTNAVSPFDYTDTEIFPHRFYRAMGR